MRATALGRKRPVGDRPKPTRSGRSRLSTSLLSPFLDAYVIPLSVGKVGLLQRLCSLHSSAYFAIQRHSVKCPCTVKISERDPCSLRFSKLRLVFCIHLFKNLLIDSVQVLIGTSQFVRPGVLRFGGERQSDQYSQSSHSLHSLVSRLRCRIDPLKVRFWPKGATGGTIFLAWGSRIFVAVHEEKCKECRKRRTQ